MPVLLESKCIAMIILDNTKVNELHRLLYDSEEKAEVVENGN